MMPSALDNLPRLTPVDTAADAAGTADRATATASFDACLHRAQSQAVAPDGGKGPGDQGANSETSSRNGNAAGTTSQDAPSAAAPHASGAEADDFGTGSLIAPQGPDDGDGGDWLQASAGKAETPASKDHKDACDDTTVVAAAAALMGAQVQAAPAGTEGAVQASPDGQPTEEAGTSLAARAATAVGGRLMPAASATPPADSPSTEGNISAATDGPAAAGPAAAGAPSLPVSPFLPMAAALQAGATLPADSSPPPKNLKTIEAAVDPAAQGQGALAGPTAAPLMEGPKEPAAAAAAAPVAAAATEMALPPKMIASPIEATSDPAAKAAAKTMAAEPAAGSFAASPSSPGQAAQGAEPATASKAADGGQSDRVRFVQRVEQAFQSMSDQGGTVRLKLSPPELGSLRLVITVRNGALTARAETETAAARNLLLDNLPALRERLAQQDIKVQRFDVDLMDRGQGGAPGQASYSSDSSGRQENHRSRGTAAAEVSEAPAVADAGIAGGDIAGNQLNVVI